MLLTKTRQWTGIEDEMLEPVATILEKMKTTIKFWPYNLHREIGLFQVKSENQFKDLQAVGNIHVPKKDLSSPPYTQPDSFNGKSYLDLLQRHRLILLSPYLLTPTPKRRRSNPIDLPQPPLSLVDMVLPIVPLILNMRLKQSVQPIRHSGISSIFVWLLDCNVSNNETNERFAARVSKFSLYEDVVVFGLDEIHHDVESW